MISIQMQAVEVLDVSAVVGAMSVRRELFNGVVLVVSR